MRSYTSVTPKDKSHSVPYETFELILMLFPSFMVVDIMIEKDHFQEIDT